MALLTVLRRIEHLFLVSIFLVMVGLFSFNVLLREFGGQIASDFAWIEEAVRLLNLFLVFGALGLALEKGRHVGVDTLRSTLPASVRAWLLKLIDAVGGLFSCYLVWLGWRMVTFVLATGQRSPTLDIPMGWIYMAPLVGFGLLALRFTLSFFGIIDRFGRTAESPTQ